MPATPPAPLFGRDEEREALCAIVARDGVALVAGEAGIGKTALALAAVQSAGRRLVHGGGFATLVALPYLPLQVALGRPVAGDEVAVARQVEAAVQDGVLLVDDIQWTDAATRSVLALLAGRVALVLTTRPDSATLDALETMGAETIRLAPLPDRAAAMVVRQVNPDINDTDIRRVLARAGGNPLLLEETARGGRISPTIARAITSQLELASPTARWSLQLLALAERPLGTAAFGPDLDELVQLGMVTVEGSTVAIRHGLIAEALTAGMAAGDRASAHAAVATLVEDPADQALHLARAGRGADAGAVAARALEETWDMRRRLVLLRLLADVATGPDVLPRRLAAARLAVEVEQPAVVIELLEPAAAGDPGLLAIRDGLLARALATLGRQEAAELALDRCRRGRAHDPTGEAAHLVAVETALAHAHVGDLAAALEILDRADIDGARGDPVFVHRRAGLRSTVRFLEGEAPDVDGMRAALDDAVRDRNPGQALANSINLHSMLLATDGPSPALEFSHQATQRLGAAGIDAWRLRSEAVQDMIFVGRPAEGVVVVDELLEAPLPVDTLTWTLVLRAEALVQLGRFTEASASLARVEPILTDEWSSRGEYLTTSAAAAHWSGSLRNAVVAADKALAVPTLYAANHMFPALTRAWATFELGQSPRPLPDARPGWLVDAAVAEWDALHAWSLGEPSRDLFLRAASLWDGRIVFRAMLCRWAAADAARRTGFLETATLLRGVLDEAEHLGFEPIARRARRSLRLAGVRVPRAQAAVLGTALLTPREHEILGLVADGLANIEIARRMGLGRPTVARIISNAMAKLGADTRAQAVALVQAGPR